jgi:hypothetical protein
MSENMEIDMGGIGEAEGLFYEGIIGISSLLGL